MKHKQGGFTLIELMFTVVVLAVLLAIGVPNFRDFVRNSRMTSAANDLLSDLNFARSESVKRRSPVTFCKSPSGSECDDDTDTPFGAWMIFVDDADPGTVSANDGNGVVDDDEEILRTGSAAISITGTGNGVRVVYEPSGFPDAGAPDPLSTVIFCDSRGNNISVGSRSAARALTISTLGRAALTREVTDITTLGGCE